MPELTTDHGQRYGDWAAPKFDGALLIWPQADTIAELARRNRDALDAAADVIIHGMPLPDLRRDARTFVGHGDVDAPLVATGHQCELHHPGVWIKNAVVSAAAEACGGVAYHFAVDTDSPKHLKLRWPGFSMPITDDARVNAAAWTGLLEPPSPAHLEVLIDAASRAEADGTASPLVGQFLGDCRAFLVDQRDAVAPLDLPSMTANAQHRLDWSLGLDYRELLLGGVLESEAWATFVCHVAADADRFASAYNAALAGYRAEAGIDAGSDRPMPDLDVAGDEIELPFWLDDLDAGTRVRAVVRQRGDGLALVTKGDTFVFDADASPRDLLAWLRRRRLRLTTRALSLTIFLRLCVCDVFVHGIGGGHYDQVADRLIRDYFRLDPPGFVVATATLFHPTAVETERVCVPCLEQEGHEIEHDALGEAKRQWLQKIEAADGFHARRAVFDAMHAARRVALKTDAAFADWRRRRDEADARLDRESDVFDRELFYAVQPRDRLDGLIIRVREAFGLAAETAGRPAGRRG